MLKSWGRLSPRTHYRFGDFCKGLQQRMPLLWNTAGTLLRDMQCNQATRRPRSLIRHLRPSRGTRYHDFGEWTRFGIDGHLACRKRTAKLPVRVSFPSLLPYRWHRVFVHGEKCQRGDVHVVAAETQMQHEYWKDVFSWAHCGLPLHGWSCVRILS